MKIELTAVEAARQRRFAKFFALLSATLSSSVVLATAVFMVTGTAGLA